MHSEHYEGVSVYAIYKEEDSAKKDMLKKVAEENKYWDRPEDSGMLFKKISDTRYSNNGSSFIVEPWVLR